jgi:predicted metal-binding membrane protein
MTPHAPGLLPWLVMTGTTMLPSALPALRHVSLNSLQRRRRRAVAEFVLAYLALWTAFGLLLQLALDRLPALDPRQLTVGALLLAAAWQLTPAHLRALRGCHRTVPLPATGWPAAVGAGRFGLTNAGSCIGSCWCLMAAMCCAAGPAPLWAAAIGTGVFVEKTSAQPQQVARLGGLVLVIVALFAALAAPAAHTMG